MELDCHSMTWPMIMEFVSLIPKQRVEVVSFYGAAKPNHGNWLNPARRDSFISRPSIEVHGAPFLRSHEVRIFAPDFLIRGSAAAGWALFVERESGLDGFLRPSDA